MALCSGDKHRKRTGGLERRRADERVWTGGGGQPGRSPPNWGTAGERGGQGRRGTNLLHFMDPLAPGLESGPEPLGGRQYRNTSRGTVRGREKRKSLGPLGHQGGGPYLGRGHDFDITRINSKLFGVRIFPAREKNWERSRYCQ